MIRLKAKFDEWMPEYQTELSAGCDVYACKDILISAGQTEIVPTGLSIESYYCKGAQIPELQMRLRSSLAVKHNLSIPNGVGTIDADYPGEIGIIIHNSNSYGHMIKKGERVGQLVLNYVHRISNVRVKSEKRTGGYGSTNG